MRASEAVVDDRAKSVAWKKELVSGPLQTSKVGG